MLTFAFLLYLWRQRGAEGKKREKPDPRNRFLQVKRKTLSSATSCVIQWFLFFAEELLVQAKLIETFGSFVFDRIFAVGCFDARQCYFYSFCCRLISGCFCLIDAAARQAERTRETQTAAIESGYRKIFPLEARRLPRCPARYFLYTSHRATSIRRAKRNRRFSPFQSNFVSPVGQSRRQTAAEHVDAVLHNWLEIEMFHSVVQFESVWSLSFGISDVDLGEEESSDKGLETLSSLHLGTASSRWRQSRRSAKTWKDYNEEWRLICHSRRWDPFVTFVSCRDRAGVCRDCHSGSVSPWHHWDQVFPLFRSIPCDASDVE